MSGSENTKKSAQVKALKSNTVLRISVSELLLTFLALVVLVTISSHLGEGERPLGLGQRYAVHSGSTILPSTTIKPTLGNPSPQSQQSWRAPNTFGASEPDKKLRAQWLNRHAGAVLILLAGCGWLTLTLGRRIAGVGIKLPLIAALWCVTGNLLATFAARWAFPKPLDQFIGEISLWLFSAVALSLVALWNGLRAARLSQAYPQIKHGAASPWVYPGFVLFSSIGLLWLVDWAARGHLDKQFVGIYQVDALWLAYLIFTLVAAHQGQLLAGFSRFASWLDRFGADPVNRPNKLMLAGLLAWIGLLVAAGHLGAGEAGQIKIYKSHAAMLSELMRVPIWLALGWMTYRWVETGQRPVQGIVAVAALLLMLVLGLKTNHDGGPMLAQTLAVVWIAAGLLQSGLASKCSPILSWSVAIGAALLGTAGSIWLAFALAPGDRVAAMELGFDGKLDFLSVLNWFLDAAPVSGFGIGKTPWCGYAQQVAGLATQCLRAGVPSQISSDYTVAAMLAVWGGLPTLMLLGALFLWLGELIKGPSEHTEALNLGLLRQWIVMGFAVTSGVQVVISVAGTLGKMPLTGIAFPIGLSLGGAGLVSSAIFAGLSANRVYFKKRETRKNVERL